MLKLPSRPTARIALADWLELSAITTRRRSSSPGDLERALQRAAIFPDRGEQIEAKLADVVAELEARSLAAGAGYPFDLEGGGVISFRSDAWQTRSTYLFCLGLTAHGNRPNGRGTFPERIFEGVSTHAARKYIGGEAVRFGSPRHESELATRFGDAVDAIAVKLGEGGGFNKRPHIHWTKDWGLDLVAWRPLPDKLPGQLVLFGGCASGKDWEDKLGEVDPLAWSHSWMRQPMVSQVLRGFFIPGRLDNLDEWTTTSNRAGVIFDRCRIAHLSATLPAASPHGNGIDWARAAFRSLASRN